MWRVEFIPKDHVLSIRLTHDANLAQIRELGRAHAAALESTGGEDYRVFFDMRGLLPLDAEALTLLSDIKHVAASQDGFRGMVILVDSPTVAMQQHRTRIREKNDPSLELITLEENQARRFLARPTER